MKGNKAYKNNQANFKKIKFLQMKNITIKIRDVLGRWPTIMWEHVIYIGLYH